jgi:hypothetical protein
MLGLIWKGRGMGSSDKRKHVKDLVDEYSLDFIGIQETQGESFKGALLHQIGARQQFFWHVAASNGRYRGILVGIRNDKFDVV